MAIFRPKFKREESIQGIKLALLLGGITFFQTMGMQTITASASAFLTGFAIVFVLALKLIAQRQFPRPLDLVITLICIIGLGLVTESHG